MGKKKGKKDVEKKLALAARKEAKQEKSARKRLTKQQGGSLDDDEEELDQVLQVYKKQEQVSTAVISEGDKPMLEAIETEFPLPRANATLCDVDGEKRDCFYLFGGEYFDGVANIFLDDMLRYEVAKKEWKKVLTAPRPNPRCAHSCVSYKQSLYIFGGEFENADQYHHFRDLWKFDTRTLKWTEISARNPPSARSGHVAFVWKNFMVIFGGFFEAARETKWYNDVSIFNLQTEMWMDVPQSRLAAKPEPRSACNISSFGTDKILIHGGFSKMKSVNAASETKVHSDGWVLHLSPLQQQKPPSWERWMSSSKGSSGITPNGRAGTASVTYKSRMLVFGGVVDSELQHHKVDSVFYNSLIALDMDRRKWFPLKVKEKVVGGGRRRRKKTPSSDDEGKEDNDEAEQASDDTDSSDDLEEDEDVDINDEDKTGWDLDMLRANMFAFVDGDGNIVYERIDDDDDAKIDPVQEGKTEESSEEEEKEEDETKEEEKVEDNNDTSAEKQIESPSIIQSTEIGASPKAHNTKLLDPKITSSSVMFLNPETKVPEAVRRKDPLPRINASLLTVGHTLYLYGGILEVGDREVTLDDMWCVDLRKRENWECLWPGTMHRQVWRGAAFDDDDSYISTGREEESDDGDDDDDDAECSEEETKADNEKNDESGKKKHKKGLRQEIACLNEKYQLDDENRTPIDNEPLADFYSRTSAYWNDLAAKELIGTDSELSNKELKRQGFKLAQTRYNELEPVLNRLAELNLSSNANKEKDDKGGSKKKSKKSSRR